MSIQPGYISFPVLNQQFIVQSKYKFIRELGQGAYGVVCAAEDTEIGEKVAIKKNCKLFERPILTKRALREIKLLQHFNGHKNITGLLDMEIPSPNDYNDIYIVQELMEADLHQIVRSGQPLSDAHYQSFIYQILCGLKYIHSANVLHRDLKPGNLLVNADCDLKICDFGLARGFVDTPDHTGFMTEYVATRWYRAPEIMLSFQSYTKAIDMWSVGCIFAELLGSKPLFKGRDYVDQLNQILYVLGTPDDETLKRIGSERAILYIRSLQKFPKIPFSQLYPNAKSSALDLLEKLLAFDPSERITVEEALKHPYLQLFHDVEDEPSCNSVFDFSFEEVEDTEIMKAMIVKEVQNFKAKKNKLRLNINGLSNHKGLATPTPTSMHVRDLPTDKATQDGLAAVLQRTAPMPGSPMNVDERLLEKDLSGQI